jgi:hypothetical protein
MSRTCIALALVAFGCGDPVLGTPDAGPEPEEDAGREPEVDAGMDDAGPDAGPLPGAPPVVTSTRPRTGEMDVVGTAGLEVRFSRAMDVEETGTIRATVGDTVIALGAFSWNEDEDVVTVAPDTRWPSGSRIDVTIEGFASAEGVAMEEAYETVFHTSDEGAPSVTAATPMEGSTLDADAVTEIVLTFSEAMNPYVGALEGAPIGELVWTADDELRADVTGLEDGTAYHVVLAGFEDVAGNALDGTLVLADGALDFSTTPDTDPPVLIDSSPTNGQLDVAIMLLPEIALTFDEPMDTSVRTATLDGTTTLTGNWSVDGTELRFTVAGRLRPDTTHALSLIGLEDRAGNALDPNTGLTDGVLSFTTSTVDEALPFVQFSAPAEGEDTVGTRITNIEILFSEAMRTTRTSVELVGGGETRSLSGVWNPAGTRLTLPVGAPLRGHTAYTIDVSAFVDASGNGLDLAHPYLGDAVLDFETSTPTGESCADPLTITDATRDGAAFVWNLGGARFTTSDQPPRCGGTTLRDGFIEYVKTTGELADAGGRALRITSTMGNDSLSDLVLIEVTSGSCARATATRHVCLGGSRSSVQYIDAPAGTYYVTVATSGTTFRAAEVRIEEVSTIAEGETCNNPYDTTSANHRTIGVDDHEWTIAGGAGTSVEATYSTEDPDVFTCNSSTQGPDVLIEVQKTRADSILDVALDPFPSETNGTSLEARTTCDRAPPREDVLQCTRLSSTPRNVQVAAPVGPVYLWLASPNSELRTLQTTVRVREIDPGLGETCQTAIPLATEMTHAITPDAATDYFHPSSCPTAATFPAGNVTWYRYTTQREVTTVRAGAVGGVALTRRSNSEELECVGDAFRPNIGRRLPVGTELCIAVPSGGAVTSLSILEHDWRGVTGTIDNLEITRPLDGTGAPISLTSEAWLTADATSLYMGINVGTLSSVGIVVAPRAGGPADIVRPSAATVIGNGGAMFGQALFSIDERSTTTSPTTRLYRLFNSTGSFEPAGTVWDTGTTYPGIAIRGLTRVSGLDQLAYGLANTTANGTFYTADAAAPGMVMNRGTNANVTAIHAVAANATYVWFTGSARIDGTARSSVYRLPWTGLATATPTLLAPWESVSVGTGNAGIAYDDVRDILYFKSTQSGEEGVYAIFDAASATPYFGGMVAAIGRSVDAGLAIDTSVPALFLFETTTDTNGNFAEVR